MKELRKAATVILARPARNGLEIYLTRRSARSAFAPDAYVFPGGTVDAADGSEQALARTIGLQAERLSAQFSAVSPRELPNPLPPLDLVQARAVSFAALRELFEEAGVLVVCRADGTTVDAQMLGAPALHEERMRVCDGTLPFAAFLERHDWYADARALTLFSHWITPESEPRRYDTYFFVATVTADRAARADAVETHDGIWAAPATALARFHAGDLHLVYPTIKHLERLRAFASVEDLAAFAARKPILTILPTASPAEGFEMPAALEGVW